MSTARISKFVLGSSFYLVLQAPVFGDLNIWDHDWTVSISDGSYGFQGYHGTTYAVFGSHVLFLPLPIQVTTAAFAALLVTSLLILSGRLLKRIRDEE
ncbi:MAG: hypothetical protein WCQ21_29035 [Verrucomicrobiota bacterium]